MGINIDATAYNINDVVGKIAGHTGAETPYAKQEIAGFVRSVVDECGVFVTDDIFVIVDNEYYDEYNPDRFFSGAISSRYDHWFWFNGTPIPGATAEETDVLLQEFGLEPFDD